VIILACTEGVDIKNVMALQMPPALEQLAPTWLQISSVKHMGLGLRLRTGVKRGNRSDDTPEALSPSPCAPRLRRGDGDGDARLMLSRQYGLGRNWLEKTRRSRSISKCRRFLTGCILPCGSQTFSLKSFRDQISDSGCLN